MLRPTRSTPRGIISRQQPPTRKCFAIFRRTGSPLLPRSSWLFAYYFLTQFDQAAATLAKVTSGPPLPAEIQQVADGLLPQILSAKAAALPGSEPARKSTFENAIGKFTEYINRYPQAQDLENTIFSRAIAEYQVGKYDDAVKDLELNLQRFPQSGTISNTKSLLAVTLATIGNAELLKGDASGKAKASELYKRAADYLREIIKKKEDVALINEANFQVGRDFAQSSRLHAGI